MCVCVCLSVCVCVCPLQSSSLAISTLFNKMRFMQSIRHTISLSDTVLCSRVQSVAIVWVCLCSCSSVCVPSRTQAMSLSKLSLHVFFSCFFSQQRRTSQENTNDLCFVRVKNFGSCQKKHKLTDFYTVGPAYCTTLGYLSIKTVKGNKIWLHASKRNNCVFHRCKKVLYITFS